MTSKRWFTNRCQQVKPMRQKAFGIMIGSRRGRAVELVEMLEFAQALAELGVESLVESVDYDSDLGLAVVKMNEEAEATPGGRGDVIRCAKSLLSQFSIPKYLTETIGRRNIPPADFRGTVRDGTFPDDCTQEFSTRRVSNYEQENKY